MNFEDLMKKLQSIEEGTTTALPIAPTKDDQPGAGAGDEGAGAGDEGIEECGEMGPETPKQQDNVTMNVSMNGSGAGGIQDLINILKNIEQGTSPADDKPDHGHSDVDALFGDSYGNSAPGSSEEELLGVDAVIPTGDDLASKGGEAPKQAGGGNPWNISESVIAADLSKLYEEIKSRNDESYGRQRRSLNPNSFSDANKIQQSWARADSYDSHGNNLRGGHDEYIDDPYGHKEAARIRDRDSGPWYLEINGKILHVKGEPKVFDWKKGANNYALAILKKRPELQGKIFLTKKNEDKL